jgi:two-component system chemotaxis response regulator CheV
VAKVREVLEASTVTRLPESHPVVEGTVRIRDQVVVLVNLVKFLDGTQATTSGDRMLVLEFNEQQIAFRVSGVHQIHRCSWKSVLPAPHFDTWRTPVTGIILLGPHLVQMLDFESIAASIGMVAGPTAIRRSEETARPTGRIVVAEDSILVRERIVETLAAGGYQDVRSFDDGQHAWEFLNSATGGETPVAAVVTDVEMPRLDGLTLTRRIRETPALAATPVVVFSSIVSQSNEKKGRQVGATRQVAKPRYEQLLEAVREVMAV